MKTTPQELKDGLIKGLKVPAGQRDVLVFDSTLRGFFLRKFASGRSSYGVKFAVNGQQRRLRLGAALPGELKQMRAEASRILNDARAGKDAVAERLAAKIKPATTFGALVPTYLAYASRRVRPRYLTEITRQLTHDWAPLHDRDVTTIVRQDAVRVLDGIAATGKEVAADRARAALSGFYKWCVGRHCDTPPLLTIPRYKKNGSRERTLTDSELVEVWHAACGDDDYGRVVRLLLLTGQRREEIGGLRWEEIDTAKREIALPGTRTKNSRPHTIPLSGQALALLPAKRERDHVFGYSPYGGGFGGWSRAKGELDARIAVRRTSAGNVAPMPPWRLHDLRRSFVTIALERGLVLPHIIEAILNHRGGHRSGVAGVYNRSSYAAEKREALEKWAAHVEKIVGAHGGAAAETATREYYFASVPKKVPRGRIVVHNHVNARLQSGDEASSSPPWRDSGQGGFRAWSDLPGPKYVECNCGWAAHLDTHYRVARIFQ